MCRLGRPRREKDEGMGENGGGGARTKEASKLMKAFVERSKLLKKKKRLRGVTVNTQTHFIFPRALAVSATINHH
jgi:hypothetical protein